MAPPISAEVRAKLYQRDLTAAQDDGIVVVVEVERGVGHMDSNTVPSALQERLGSDGTAGLVQLLDTARSEWTAAVMNLSVERFERRLVEEVATLRVEMARGQAKLREDMASNTAALREEIARNTAILREEGARNTATLREEAARNIATLQEQAARNIATLREEIAGNSSALRVEMAQQGAALRVEIATTRSELLKWSFLFWVGQVITTVALVGAMLRAFVPPR